MTSDSRPGSDGAPPSTERRPVTETLHGETVEDPYRWLEDDGEAVESWTEAQNEYADAHVGGETRAALGPVYEELATVTDYRPVVVRGGRRFQRIEGPDDDHPVLYRRTEEGLRTLVDPNEWEGASMGWYHPSRDGEFVVYGRDEGGTEQYDLHVIDLDGERVDTVPDAGRVIPAAIAWTDEGFYYMRSGSAEAGGQLDKEIRYRRLPDGPPGNGRDDGGSEASDRDHRIELAIGERAWPGLEAAEDGTLVIALEEMSIRTELYVKAPDERRPRPVLTGVDATFHPTVDSGRLYLETIHEAPLGRVLSTPVERLRSVASGDGEIDPDALDVAVPEDESAVLEGVAVADGDLIVHHQRDAASALSIWDPETGTRRRTVDLPAHTSVEGLDADADSPATYYLAESFDRPVSVVRLDSATGERTVVDEQDVDVGVDLTVDREWFESEDGTAVPAYVVRQADLDDDGTAPAVVYGYGGFRANLTPTFRRFLLPFLRDGGVYVQAVLRGGAEFGEQWHNAGMREHKQNVFDDFYAVADGIVDRGYADGDRVAASGASNGGLLVGAAITQRPQRWAAASAGVPLMDMLRFHRFLLGEAWTNEYGSPEDPEAFEYLRAYSPYHNVDDAGGTVYPPTLIWTAAGDTRVHPAHARKMTARLQAAVETAEAGGPVCFRSVTETGHGVGTPTEVEVRQQLDRWTFLYDHLGLEHGAD